MLVAVRTHVAVELHFASDGGPCFSSARSSFNLIDRALVAKPLA